MFFNTTNLVLASSRIFISVTDENTCVKKAENVLQIFLTFRHGDKRLNELFVLVLEPISCWEDITPFDLFPIPLGK